MAVPAAVWCVACGAPPDVALTIERNGVMAHYGACWAHVATVAYRARDDVQAADQRALAGGYGQAAAVDDQRQPAPGLNPAGAD